MTRAKKLKKAIRSRAGKTGESYTSARRQVLEARRRRAAPAAPAVTPPAAAPATKRGVRAPGSGSRARSVTSDTAVRQKTGHGFDHWFAVLDAFGAGAKGHTASARHLSADHGVPGWHCQMITVEYERARGLRATNQSGAGDFQVSVSRTVVGTVPQVARVLADTRRRARWLSACDPQLARAVEAAFSGARPRPLAFKKDDLARMRFPWDKSTVEIHIVGKPGGKASVGAYNVKLAGPEDVEERRRLWTAALDTLKSQLAG